MTGDGPKMAEQKISVLSKMVQEGLVRDVQNAKHLGLKTFCSR